MDSRAPAYRLVRRPVPAAAAPPTLDDAQQRVVSHTSGPLLVLAGPGTGKTTAIVESVVHRISHRGIDPERVLVLTFSRKAAEELRERITLRLGRTTRQPLALTFHSYAYALVRREFVLDGEEPPTLLSGPEQLLEVRRLLRGEAEDGGGNWPERLRPALATRGFAAELRDFLLRAAERGLDGRGLARLGAQRQRDDWIAAGGFLDRYASRFDLAPVPAYDYAEIVRIAARLLGRAATRDRERQAYDVVLVDEYQDTDPAQENLLHALAGDGRELIAVGDPDQSIYGFRGADTRAVSRFASRFRAPDGSPARVIALRTCRRSGPFLLTASRRVAARLPAVQADDNPDPERQHRALVPRPGADPGTARIIIAATANQEATAIADALRRAHLMDGLAWSSMAVLVRSATRQVPVLQRALAAAGVPVQVAGDELPLTAEPGTRPLLTLLDCALRPGALDEDKAAELLTGPLGGTDALGLRRLRRALRAAAQAAGELPSEQPLAAALADPRELTMVGGPDAEADVTAGPGAEPGGPGRVRGGRGPAGGGAAGAGRADRGKGELRGTEKGQWRGTEEGEWREKAKGAVEGAAVGGGSGRRHRARRALGGVGRLRPGRHLAAGQRGGRQPRRRRRHRPGRGARPVRRGRPVQRAVPAGLAPAVPGQPGRAGDRGRHPGRAGLARRRGRGAHRAPVQGARVGPGRGGRGPGGHLARRADPGLAAVHGRARGRRLRRPRPRSRPARTAPRWRWRPSCSTRSAGCSTSRSPGPGGR